MQATFIVLLVSNHSKMKISVISPVYRAENIVEQLVSDIQRVGSNAGGI